MSAQIPLFLALSVADHDIDRCVASARRAEDAGVDAIVLLDDHPVNLDVRVNGVNRKSRTNGRGPSAEPATVLARIAAVTERIGLIGTFSATHNDSQELARRLADLDYLSGGRIGWRVPGPAGPTSPTGPGSLGRRFGARRPFEPAEIESRSAEVVESVVERWSVRTELRSPQGFPLVVASAGARFAARSADVVLLETPGTGGPGSSGPGPLGSAVNLVAPGSPDRDRGQRVRAEIHSRAEALGRTPGSVLVLPQLRVGGDTSASGFLAVPGRPAQVADELERWAGSGAADGFCLQPESLGEFFDGLLPELNRRGLLGQSGLPGQPGLPGQSGQPARDRSDLTLRSRLGLSRPTPVPVTSFTVPGLATSGFKASLVGIR